MTEALDNLQLLTALYDVLPIGVVMMNADAEVVFYNRYEEQLAGRQRETVLGKDFFRDVAPCSDSAGLGNYFSRTIGRSVLSRDLTFQFPRPFVERPRDVRLLLTSMEFDDSPLGMLFVQDISAMRALERTKDYLVGMLAHDMNNPLTAAMAAVGLSRDAAAPGASKQYLTQVEDGLQRIRRMSKNLFDVTRLQTAAVPVQFVLTDITAMAHRVVDELGAVGRASGRGLVVDAGDVVEAEVDAELLERALGNLIDNALRHAPPGSEVVVGVRSDNGQVGLSVRDHGSGVPKELRRSIFRAFTSAPGPADADGRQHQGLGLALVSLVAAEHGGRVMLDSPADGGACFSIRLPLRQRRA